MRRWAIWTTVLLLAIILPYLAFGAAIDRRITAWLADEHAPAILFACVFLLLAADIVLPVPSSVVATASGALLGPWLGTAASAAGLTAGSVGAFLIVSLAGGPRARTAGEARLARRIGPGALIVLRPVPVLAEASVFLAAAGGAARWPSAACLTGANIAIAAAYAGIGAWAGREGSLAIALLAVCAPAGLGWIGWRLLARRR